MFPLEKSPQLFSTWMRIQRLDPVSVPTWKVTSLFNTWVRTQTLDPGSVPTWKVTSLFNTWMRTQSLYAQLKRPLTFSTWVTAQKTPKSRSGDEDAAREREREREREGESATVLSCKSELFGVRGGKNPELYVSGMLFFVSQKSLFLFLLCFLKRRFFFSGSLWYRQR